MFWWYAAVSCYFQELGLIGRVMSAETDPRAEERPMFRGYEQNFTDNDRGWAWLAGIASCAELVLESSLIFTSLREAQQRTGVPAGPSCWLVLRLSLAVSARPYHCCCYPDSIKLDCWFIREVFTSGSSCHCWPVNWTASFQTAQTRVAPKNLSNQVHFPLILSSHYLWWVVG